MTEPKVTLTPRRIFQTLRDYSKKIQTDNELSDKYYTKKYCISSNWVPNSRWTEESEIGPCDLKIWIKKLAFILPILSPQKAKTRSQTNGLDLEGKRNSYISKTRILSR